MSWEGELVVANRNYLPRTSRSTASGWSIEANRSLMFRETIRMTTAMQAGGRV